MKEFRIFLILAILIIVLYITKDTNKRVRHIENEFTLEGNK